MRARAATAVIVVCAGLLALGAPAAFARDGFVTSFDGTKIVYSFFPAPGLKEGQRAPTVVNGPGYSSRRANESDTYVRTLRAAGYNVLTFDPRGFGDSGGQVEVDSPEFEARDTSKLIDFIAEQPEAARDRAGDPRLGMAGVSYGGGIQWVTAATDARVDVIAPSISWHSLVTSLDKNETAKGGWGSILFAAGTAGSASGGVVGGFTGEPAGFQFGTQNQRISESFANSLRDGKFSEADKEFFASRGPGELVRRVKIPTLITQATTDTLFTLRESIENYRIMRTNGVPVKMLWFCGDLGSPGATSHGICQTEQPDRSIVLNESVRWLNRYLKRDKSVKTGSRFEWESDTGKVHGASDYPPLRGAPLVGSGSGILPLIAGSTSGALIAAAPAVNAVNVPLPKLSASTRLVGEPRLTLDYSGNSAPSPDARVYAQIVDNRRGEVVGPVVTPIQLNLDGAPHRLTLPLEGIVADATPESSFTLQVTDGSNVYFSQRQAGAVSFSRVAVSVPTVNAAGASPPRLDLSVSPARVSAGCHRFTFRATTRSNGRARAVRSSDVTFGRRHARTDSRGFARMSRCLPRAGSYTARARKSGFRGGAAQVRARRSQSPRFAG